jgi:class 3 adenylate cyclase
MSRVHSAIPDAGTGRALSRRTTPADGDLPGPRRSARSSSIFQEGDYYGQTVNVASRIADHAGPGQVLVSQAVVDASPGAAVAFSEVGPVDLKGVSGAVRLHAASRLT